MSAITNKMILVDVTRGDCVDENRKSGKSNTGTYFICSLKNFEEFSDYFKEGNEYRINLLKVEIYKDLFEKYFLDYRDEYVGKMSSIENYISYLLSLIDDPIVGVTVRKNDSRVFMRFVNNTNPVVNAFRNTLYEDLSLIAIEKCDSFYYIYPVINEKYIKSKKDLNAGLIIDE